jgi:hypothetical protein
MRKAPRPTTPADDTPEFLAFWSVWRPYMNANDGKGDARDAFFQHVEERGAHPQDLIDGAKWFVRNGGNQGLDQNGRPVRSHAKSWLNKRAYEDGAEMERAFQARQAERSENVVQIRTPKSKWLQEWEASKREA